MTTRGRVSAALVQRPVDEGDFPSRVIALFGHRDVTAFQFAFGRGHSQIEAWCHGTRTVTADVLLILELLEACPKSRWPKRWRDCAR